LKLRKHGSGTKLLAPLRKKTRSSETLNFHNFRGVFLIAAVLWGIALIIFKRSYLRKFFCNNQSAKISSVKAFPTDKECDELSSYKKEVQNAHEMDA
jgi:hypothetical protein